MHDEESKTALLDTSLESKANEANGCLNQLGAELRLLYSLEPEISSPRSRPAWRRSILGHLGNIKERMEMVVEVVAALNEIKPRGTNERQRKEICLSHLITKLDSLNRQYSWVSKGLIQALSCKTTKAEQQPQEATLPAVELQEIHIEKPNSADQQRTSSTEVMGDALCDLESHTEFVTCSLSLMQEIAYLSNAQKELFKTLREDLTFKLELSREALAAQGQTAKTLLLLGSTLLVIIVMVVVLQR